MRVQCVSETRITTSVYVALGDLCYSLSHTHTHTHYLWRYGGPALCVHPTQR